MHLADWRKREGLSCPEVARRLGLDGERDGAKVWNWETGKSRADADMIARIVTMTGGEVSAEDMQQLRLAWLRQHRPERFEAVDDEAAE